MNYRVLFKRGEAPTGLGLAESSGYLYVLSSCCEVAYSGSRCKSCGCLMPEVGQSSRIWIPHCNELFIEDWIENWTGLKDVRVQINA